MSLRIMNEYIFLKTVFKNIGWVFIGFVGFHRHIGLPSYDLVSVSFVWEKKMAGQLKSYECFHKNFSRWNIDIYLRILVIFLRW